MKHPKKISAIFFTVLFSVMSLGCSHGEKGYDVRLVAADSIMHDDCAMALDLLESIKAQSLDSKRDRAYHALLLSQARYRNYVVATSDSLIDVALSYYKQHKKEREKLTRAYIYKGAVMEELGDNRQAMQCYKTALTAVASDDLFNQGYIRLRLGGIYRVNMAADSNDIATFKEALSFFKQIPDSFYIASCLNEIGTSYYKTNKDSVLPYLEQGLTVARSIHARKLETAILKTTARFKLFSNDAKNIEVAKRIALSLIREQADGVNDLKMIVAYALAKQNKTDSAKYYLNQVPAILPSAASRIFYNRCMAEISRSLGDVDSYQRYYEYSDEIADSVTSQTAQYMLRDIEVKYDNETLKNENLRYRMMLVALILGSLLLLSCLALALVIIRHRYSRNRQRLKENEIIIEQLRNDSELLTRQLDDNKSMSESLKETIKHQINVFTRLVYMHNKEFLNNPKSFNTVFKQSYMINQPDTSFWMGLRDYVNSTHNGIIDLLAELHPSALRDSDINYLCLHCSGLPSSVVMLCMGYNDIHSLYNKKRRILNKLGLPYEDSLTRDVLSEYLNSLGADVIRKTDEEIAIVEARWD